jgi:N-carbamoylputrescine amidase
MKVTVCELNPDPRYFEQDWDHLTAHVKANESQLLLLPEMIFSPWFADSPHFDQETWQEAVDAQKSWEDRLWDLQPSVVLGSRPVNRGDRRLNEAYVWSAETGFRPAHAKAYLPDEDGYWEASWYQTGNGEFNPVEVRGMLIGFMICTDLWFFEHARAFGKQKVQLIACPRATPRETLDKWLAGGQAAAVVSGAYCLSSNHVSHREGRLAMGGQGWVVGPDAEILGVTSQDQKFVTVDIDPQKADRAKKTYPRYVKDKK